MRISAVIALGAALVACDDEPADISAGFYEPEHGLYCAVDTAEEMLDCTMQLVDAPDAQYPNEYSGEPTNWLYFDPVLGFVPSHDVGATYPEHGHELQPDEHPRWRDWAVTHNGDGGVIVAKGAHWFNVKHGELTLSTPPLKDPEHVSAGQNARIGDYCGTVQAAISGEGLDVIAIEEGTDCEAATTAIGTFVSPDGVTMTGWECDRSGYGPWSSRDHDGMPVCRDITGDAGAVQLAKWTG